MHKRAEITDSSDAVIELPVIEFPDDGPAERLDAAEHPFDAAERVLAATT